MAPLFRSRQINFHCCAVRSSDASPSPYRPRLKLASARLLTAVVTKTRSSHTIGLECANPGMGVFHLTPVPCETLQLTGRCCRSEPPDADGPLKEGQFCAAAATTKTKGSALRVKYRDPACAISSL